MSDKTPQNDYGVQDTTARHDRPSSDLDLYDKAVDPPLSDDFLNSNNLGLGNYSDGEMWQQVESFRMGLFADAAFSDKLDARRIEETQRQLALEGYAYINDDGQRKEFSGWADLTERSQANKDRRRYIEERGEEIWETLPEERQYQATIECTGMPNWMPPHLRMVLMRHEASRSKGGRTQDNLFGRVKKVIGDKSSAAGQSASRGLGLGGSRGGNR